MAKTRTLPARKIQAILQALKLRDTEDAQMERPQKAGI